MATLLEQYPAPKSGDPYFNPKSKGGYSDCIIGSPARTGLLCLSNCVGLARGLYAKYYGSADGFNYVPNTNAENFYSATSKAPKGKTPREGAIICWSQGKLYNSSDGCGHVAFVAKVISDEEIITCESAYGSATNWYYVKQRKKGTNGNWGAGGTFKFEGFIYQPNQSTINIKGCDLSYCQEGLNFNLLKQQGVQFALIRAGISTRKDVTMDAFVKGCETYNLKYGLYWYSLAQNKTEALAEAKACLEVIKNYSPKYPIYYDIEDKKQLPPLSTMTNQDRTDVLITFLDTVRAAGYTVGIYINPTWIEEWTIKSQWINKGYEVWEAHWVDECHCNYNKKVWQTGKLLTVGGIAVDEDYSYQDYNLSHSKQTTTSQTTTSQSNNSNTTINNSSTSSINFKVGEIVNFKGGYHYGASNAATPVGSVRTKGTAKITLVSANAKHPYHLVGVTSNVYGWVSASDIETPTENKKSVTEIAKEVIAGKWDNYPKRKQLLEAAGYSYAEVQTEVNRLLKGK